MARVSGVQGGLTLYRELDVATAVHLVGSESVEAFVAVLLVVPGRELAHPGSGVLGVAEAPGEVRLVLQCLETTLAERVVVAHPWPAARSLDAERGQHRVERVRGHRRPAIIVQGELVSADAGVLDAADDQLLGQCAGFASGHHPADDATTEQVEDHVQVEEHPGGQGGQLGDVPGPHLVGGSGGQARHGMVHRRPLVAAFPAFSEVGEQAVHGPDRAQISVVREQGSVDLARRLVDELGAVQDRHHLTALGLAQRARRCRLGSRLLDRWGLFPAMHRGPGNAECRASAG